MTRTNRTVVRLALISALPVLGACASAAGPADMLSIATAGAPGVHARTDAAAPTGTPTDALAPANAEIPASVAAASNSRFPTNAVAPTNTEIPTSAVAPTNTELPTSVVALMNTVVPTSTAAPASASLPELARQQSSYRDPQKAFMYSWFAPGAGHFYSGETTKGAVLMGAAVAGIVGGLALSSSGGEEEFGDCVYDFETHECEPERKLAPLLLGGAVAAASWVYGIVDSKPAAQRANLRSGLQVGSARVRPDPWVARRRGETRAGLDVRITW